MNYYCLASVVLFVKGLTFVSSMLPACGGHRVFIFWNHTDEGANGYVTHQYLSGSTDVGNKTDEGIWTCLFIFLA